MEQETATINQTSLQQRIEERARQKLLKALYDATEKEKSIVDFIGENTYEPRLNVRDVSHRQYSGREKFQIANEFSQAVFDKLLPKYISNVTDEWLKNQLYDQPRWPDCSLFIKE
ncbi:MAG: hypothetical protein H0W84_12085 [Bacteroidetes bacterium]|nr:hypothetical protein [Bacteroidota bacterium]